MVKSLWIVLCSLVVSLYGEIPQEEALYTVTLENGIAAWIRENATPPHIAALRVVWSKDGTVETCALDCPASDVEDVTDFFESCKEMMEGAFERAAVIAVGDFEKDQMAAFIEDHFASLDGASRPAMRMQQIEVREVPDLEKTTVSLAYPADLKKLRDVEDLKNLWCLYVFQNLVQARFEKALKEEYGTWIPTQDGRFLLPQTVCVARVDASVDHTPDILQDFLKVTQEIRTSGFEEKEFAAVKSRVLKSLLSVNQAIPASRMLASYYNDWSMFGHGCPAYPFFVQTSLSIVESLTLKNIHDLIGGYLSDDRRYVELTIPAGYDFREPEVQKMLAAYTADGCVLEVKDTEEAIDDTVDLYAQLPITDDEAKTIYKIIDTVANTNILKLAFKQGELEERGEIVKKVHPLKFLGTILCNSYLKTCLGEIEESSFKWDGVLYGPHGNDGLVNRLALEHQRNNLMRYLPGFCKAVKADVEKVRAFVLKRDWENLVKYLL